MTLREVGERVARCRRRAVLHLEAEIAAKEALVVAAQERKQRGGLESRQDAGPLERRTAPQRLQSMKRDSAIEMSHMGCSSHTRRGTTPPDAARSLPFALWAQGARAHDARAQGELERAVGAGLLGGINRAAKERERAREREGVECGEIVTRVREREKGKRGKCANSPARG